MVLIFCCAILLKPQVYFKLFRYIIKYDMFYVMKKFPEHTELVWVVTHLADIHRRQNVSH